MLIPIAVPPVLCVVNRYQNASFSIHDPSGIMVAMTRQGR